MCCAVFSLLTVTQLTCQPTCQLLNLPSPRPTSLNHFPFLFYFNDWGCTCVLVLNCITLTQCVTHTHTHFWKMFLCHIFACTEASNCQRPPVISAICFFPLLLLIWRKVFIFIYQSLLPQRERKLQCLQYSVCVCVYVHMCMCVRGLWSNAGGYYEETEMRQEIPLIGNKTPSYLFK